MSTTKIADRQLALHIADKSWKSIIKHLDRKRVIQEEIEAREAHRKAMKEGSESMTKNWSNSVEVCSLHEPFRNSRGLFVVASQKSERGELAKEEREGRRRSHE